MASASFSISGLGIGGSHVKKPELCLTKRNISGLGLGLGLGPGFGPKLSVQRKSNSVMISNRKPSICAEYRDDSRGGSGDFLAGFLLGSAILGAVGYIFAPQIRRSLLNEDEYGFRKPKRPMYYDEGLERTRQTLNKKIGQLNSAIDNVSSRLRRGKSKPATEIGADPEVEATM